MDDISVFERLVADEMERRAGPDPIVDDAAIFTAIAATQSLRWRFGSMFGAARFLLAGAIVALFGGFLLAGVLTQPPPDRAPTVGASASPEATSTQPVELPAEIPDGVESGTADTPLGPARWVYLRGDATTLPSRLDPVPLPGRGYVTLESYVGPPQLWRSPDLINWASEPLTLPMESLYVDLGATDGTIWLTGSESASLWRSSDSVEWTEVGLDGLAPPGPDGYAWSLQLGTPLAFDGVTIVPFTYRADASLTSRALTGTDRWELYESGLGVYTLENDQRDRQLATIRFEDTGNGLRVIDAEDGTELTFLDGVSLDSIEHLTGDGGIPPVNGLAMVVGNELVGVDMPEAMTAAPEPAYMVDGAGLAAYVIANDGLVHVHRSEDGRDWTETDIIGDDPGEPSDIWYVYPNRSRGWLAMEGTDDSLWTSADGKVWESRRSPGVPGDPVASGWLWIQEVGEPTPWQPLKDAEAATMWYLPEDGEPVPIDLPILIEPMERGYSTPMAVEGGGSGGWVSSNTMVRTFHEGEGTHRRFIWIVTFADATA